MRTLTEIDAEIKRLNDERQRTSDAVIEEEATNIVGRLNKFEHGMKTAIVNEVLKKIDLTCASCGRNGVN